MPMTWNADADAKLFTAVLKTCNVKLDYAALAAEMGDGCTPKAITHRVSNLRARAAGKGADASEVSSAPATPTKARKAPAAKTPRTPRSAAGGKRKGKVVKSKEMTGMDDEDGVNVKSEDELMASPSKKPKVEADEEDGGDETYMG